MAITGSIVNQGDVVNITYSGGIQQWVVPKDGLYKLEVWGASGGNQKYGRTGSAGGHSVGYKELKKDTILYIVVGQQGYASGTNASAFNGGGRAASEISPGSWNSETTAGGGGATHIATKSGILSSLTNSRGDVLIVAGGGAGGFMAIGGEGDQLDRTGGTGGGLSGGYGEGHNNGFGDPGTQTTGYGFGQGNYGSGGGWFGGRSSGNLSSAAGGGSGYIGGIPQLTYNGLVYTPLTENGKNSGNGKAAITLIGAVGSIVYSGDKPTTVMTGYTKAKLYSGDIAL